jgi:hypothetical protein
VSESYGGNNGIFKIKKLKFAHVMKSSRLGVDMNHIQKLLSQYVHIASTAAVTVHVNKNVESVL